MTLAIPPLQFLSSLVLGLVCPLDKPSGGGKPYEVYVLKESSTPPSDPSVHSTHDLSSSTVAATHWSKPYVYYYNRLADVYWQEINGYRQGKVAGPPWTGNLWTVALNPSSSVWTE
jgi:hypothetical protein